MRSVALAARGGVGDWGWLGGNVVRFLFRSLRGSLASTLPGYDVVLLLESLEHIRQKQRLLHKLRQVARKLVLRTSCIPSLAHGERVVVFGGSMSLSSCADVEKAVQAAGWRLTVPPRLWGADEAASTIRHWRDRLEAANASLLGGSEGENVLHASIASILTPEHHHADAPNSAYWSDGHHRLIDIVAENPMAWAFGEDGTCQDTPPSIASPRACSEKVCIVGADVTEHDPWGLRRLLAAPWLHGRHHPDDLDDDAIRRALPAEDHAIIDELLLLHQGKVPESAFGISAKVTHNGSNLGTGRVAVSLPIVLPRRCQQACRLRTASRWPR